MFSGLYETHFKENTIVRLDAAPIFPLFLVFANSWGKYLMLSRKSVPLLSPASVFGQASGAVTVGL